MKVEQTKEEACRCTRRLSSSPDAHRVYESGGWVSSRTVVTLDGPGSDRKTERMAQVPRSAQCVATMVVERKYIPQSILCC
jgi:hypothetical protein